MAARKSLDSQDSLDRLQTLTCPLLEKLREATTHIRQYIRGLPQLEGKTEHVAGHYTGGQGDPRSGWGRSAVTWDKDAGVLVLCFRVCCAQLQDPSASIMVQHTDLGGLQTYDESLAALSSAEVSSGLAGFAKEAASAPPWLTACDPAALVSSPVLAMFEGQRDSLAASIRALTGGVCPQCIKCFGWCLAGMVATLAATWAAIQYPSADVRCITFGSQKLGNAAFARTFRWLVGLSYRVVYHRDPVPTQKAKAGLLASELVHVHGEIHIKDALGELAGPLTDDASGDHDWERYSQALGSRCQTELKRELALHQEFVCPFERDSQPLCNPRPSLDHSAAAAAEVPRHSLPAASDSLDIVSSPCAEDLSTPSITSSSRGVPTDGRQNTHSAGLCRDCKPAQLQQEQQQADAHVVGSRSGAESLGRAGTASTSEALEMLAACPAARESEDLGPREGVPHALRSVSESAADSAAVEALEQGGLARNPSSAVPRLGSQAGITHAGQEAADSAQEALQCTVHVAAEAGTADSITSLQQVLIAGKISQAAVFSAAAYRDEETFRRTTGIAKCKLIVDKDERNTHVHVGWLSDGTAVLSFRGTATMQDGLADVQVMHRDVHFLRDYFPGSRAHIGFLKQFMGVCKPDQGHGDLAAVVSELSGGRAPARVLCCGHSLGGALATLGATWAALQWSQADVRCITFGSPRVGNRMFRHAFHSVVGTSYRLVHGRDPVPALPPSIVYRHVQGAIHVRPDGIVALKSRPFFLTYPPNVLHHSMTQYNASICLHFPDILHTLPALGSLVSKARAAVSGRVLEAQEQQHTSNHVQLDDAEVGEAEELQKMHPALRLLCGLRP